ncbi:hypothetical protein [Haloarcula sediminis]|uniref:hypothetical protein n=1 Tax=Haloarcula sediminis TaxID=3111777 RepID=UPI002D77E112|nr:hypothetical protein [Haloarcula sp. CK38]
MSVVRSGLLVARNLRNLLTAPGTVLHELAHYVACVVVGVNVAEVKLYIPPKGLFSTQRRLGYVRHENVSGAPSMIMISFAPFVMNVVGTFVALYAATQTTGILTLGWFWLGYSFASHASPSHTDWEGAFVSIENLPSRWRPVGRILSYITDYLAATGSGWVVFGFAIAVVVFGVKWGFAFLIGAVIIIAVLEGILIGYEWVRGQDYSIKKFWVDSAERKAVERYGQFAGNLEPQQQEQATEAETGNGEATAAVAIGDGKVRDLFDGLQSRRSGIRRRTAEVALMIAAQAPSKIFEQREELQKAIAAESHPDVKSLLVATEMRASKAATDRPDIVDDRLGIWIDALTYQVPGSGAVAEEFTQLSIQEDVSLIDALIPLNNCVLYSTDATSAARAMVILLDRHSHMASRLAPLYEDVVNDGDASLAERLVASRIFTMLNDPRGFVLLDNLRESEEDWVAFLAESMLDELESRVRTEVRKEASAPPA